MEEAETDEIRLFWLEKLTTLVGGIDILKNACNESVWKRASRRPPGKYNTAISSTVESACQDCGTGKYSTTLAAVQESSCVNCPSGKYGADVGLSSTNDCDDCTISLLRTTQSADNESPIADADATAYI